MSVSSSFSASAGFGSGSGEPISVSSAEEALTTARRPTSCSAAHFEEARKPRSDDSRMTLRSSSRARGSDNEMGAAERWACMAVFNTLGGEREADADARAMRSTRLLRRRSPLS